MSAPHPSPQLGSLVFTPAFLEPCCGHASAGRAEDEPAASSSWQRGTVRRQLPSVPAPVLPAVTPITPSLDPTALWPPLAASQPVCCFLAWPEPSQLEIHTLSARMNCKPRG